MNLAQKIRQLPKKDFDFSYDPILRIIYNDALATHIHNASLRELVNEDLHLRHVQFTLNAKNVSQRSGLFGLWIDAFAGDDDALFDLIKLFKELAGASWVQRRLRENCTNPDWIRKYGLACAFLKKGHGSEDRTLRQFLAVNWEWGYHLNSMSDQEIIFCLKNQGLFPNRGPTNRDRTNIRKRVNRMGLRRM